MEYQYSLVWKSLNMKDWGSKLFRGIHVRIDISISTRPMITKFGKQVHLEKLTQMTNQPGADAELYYKELPCIKLHSPLNKSSLDVTWYIKYVISILPQGLWLVNVAWWSLTMRDTHPKFRQSIKHVVFWGYVKNVLLPRSHQS